MLTLVIATAGRAKSLEATLVSLTKVIRPKSSFQIIIAVNGADEASFLVAKSFCGQLPLQSYIFSEFGKNRALNKIIPKLQSGWVLFTDDDIMFDSMWLLQWERKLLTSSPQTVCAGPIAIVAEPGLMDKMKDLDLPLDFLYSQSNERIDGEIRPEDCWGGNLAIHADWFRRFSFNENIGPDGTSKYRMGSEVEFCLRLKQHGARFEFFSQSKVFHRVSEKQLTEEWILRRFFRAGRSSYLCRLRDKKVMRLPINDLAELMMGTLFSSILCLRTFDQAKKRKVKFERAFLTGQIYEYFFGSKIV